MPYDNSHLRTTPSQTRSLYLNNSRNLKVHCTLDRQDKAVAEKNNNVFNLTDIALSDSALCIYGVFFPLNEVTDYRNYDDRVIAAGDDADGSIDDIE